MERLENKLLVCVFNRANLRCLLPCPSDESPWGLGQSNIVPRQERPYRVVGQAEAYSWLCLDPQSSDGTPSVCYGWIRCQTLRFLQECPGRSWRTRRSGLESGGRVWLLTV